MIVKRPATRNITYTTKLMFDYSQSDFEAGTRERQVFNLKAEDKVSMELWGITQEDWEYEPVFFFGEWSETKMRYMITMLGCVSFMNWYYNEDSFLKLLWEMCCMNHWKSIRPILLIRLYWMRIRVNGLNFLIYPK